MKRFLPILLLLPLLAGCVNMERLDSVKSSAEKLMEEAEDAMATRLPDGSLLTKAEAERIALEHQGLNRDQVNRMHTEYELDDGRHVYDVEFRQGTWKYSFEIDAETGEVLSWEREFQEA